MIINCHFPVLQSNEGSPEGWASSAVKRESSFLSLPPEWAYTISPPDNFVSNLDPIAQSTEMELLTTQIKDYNSKVQLEAFQISKIGENDARYEGALRIYMDNDGHNYTKAVRLDSTVTCAQLLPQLWDKFNIQGHQREGGKLYILTEEDECLLQAEDKPLAMAVSCASIPRFVFKVPSAQKPSESSKVNSFVNIVRQRFKKSKTAKHTDVNGNKHKHQLTSSTSRKALFANNQAVFSKPTKSTVAAQSSISPRTTLKPNQMNKGSSTLGRKSGESASLKPFKSLENIHKVNLQQGMDEKMSTQTIDRKSRKIKKTPTVRCTAAAAMHSVDSQLEYLEVFGSMRMLGAESIYVPVQGNTNVQQMIEKCLEQCGLSLPSEDFYLCDVIGRSEEGMWFEDYAREMSEFEQPLMAMSVMKPSEGLSRRFEFRYRYSNELVPRGSIGSGGSGSASGSGSGSGRRLRPDLERKLSASLSSHSGTGLQEVSRFPRDCPYLLTVELYDNLNDLILHRIDDDLISIGNAYQEPVCEINLFAPDILSQHCWICKKQEDENGRPADHTLFSITALPGAYVAVNDEQVKTSQDVYPGDAIALGRHYIFLLKDPTFRPTMLDEADSAPKAPVSESDLQTREWEKEKSAEYERDQGRYKLPYLPNREEELLDKITKVGDTASREPEWYRLAPALLFSMCLDYSSSKLGVESTKGLLLRIASAAQTTVTELTKKMAANEIDPTGCNPSQCMEKLVPLLNPVLLWLANSLQLRNFLLASASNFLPDAHLPVSESAKVIDEVTAVLSGAATHSFQQTIYYTTKILYPSIGSLLTCNPFNQQPCSSQVEDVLSTLGVLLDTSEAMAVPRSVAAQLFSYLYFFMGTAVVNLLMEPDAGKIYYCWEQGVKIRKNLELLETWASDNNMDEANKFLEKAISVADFLSTRKQTLLQADWTSLRQLFPRLNAAQVLLLLEDYQLGSGKTRPPAWNPTPEDQGEAILRDTVEETYDDHPPLLLPTDFDLDLHRHVYSTKFTEYYNDLLNVFEDDSDSGFHMGRSSPMSPTSSDDLHHPSPVGNKNNSSNRAIKATPSLLAAAQATVGNVSTVSVEENLVKRRRSSTQSGGQGESTPTSKVNSQRHSHTSQRSTRSNADSDSLCSSEEAASAHQGASLTAGSSLCSNPHRTLMDLSKLSFDDISADVEDNADDTPAPQPLLMKAPLPEVDGAFKPRVLKSSTIEIELSSSKDNTQGFCSVDGSILQPSTEKLYLDPSTDTKLDPLLDSPTVPAFYNEALIRFFSGETIQEGKLITVTLERGPRGLGLGLIDGLYTSLCETGIYVRQLIAGGPAELSARISIGDRILAVEGHSLLGADYQSAMNIIKGSNDKMRFLLKTGEYKMAEAILAGPPAAQ